MREKLRPFAPLLKNISRGFTLVELLVVIGILSILFTVTIVVFNPAYQLEKSRDSKRKSDISQIKSALEIYRSDVGSYPDSVDHTVQNSGSSLVDDPSNPNVTYIQKVPKDPKMGTNYYYLKDSPTVGGYTIYSCLENTNDPDELSASTSPAAPDSDAASALGCQSGWGYYGVVNP